MVKFDDRGLVPAVVQDVDDGAVLTLAYMNREALQKTLEGPDTWFYSRSRRELWHKGETSGNFLKVESVTADCDGDALLVRVRPTGPACHTGERTCFHNPVEKTPETEEIEAGPGVLDELFDVIEERKESAPEGSYTASLLEAGRERISQKVIEEAGELALAGMGNDGEHLAREAADLLYHTLVLLSAAEVPPHRVWEELRSRRR